MEDVVSFTEKNSDRRELAKILPLKMPLGICIEPTNLCNFNCVQCPVSKPYFKEKVGFVGHMNMELYKKILHDIKAMGKVINLNLYGDGEPLLNRNIIEMVKLARELDVSTYITITTNASLLTEEMAIGLIKAGLTYLRVSIYSVNNEKFKNETNTKLTPKIIYDNVKNFKRVRDNLKSKTPFLYVKLIDTYGDENEEFKKQYSEIADELNIETPMNWNGYDGIDFISKIDPDRKTDETLVQGFYDSKGKSGLKKICTTAFHSLNIKSNGDVTICIVDWNKGTKVGNICNNSLSKIWFGEPLREFRKLHISGERHKNPSCKNCKYLYCNPDNIDGLSEEKYEEILNYKGESNDQHRKGI